MNKQKIVRYVWVVVIIALASLFLVFNYARGAELAQIPGTVPEDDSYSVDRFYRDANGDLTVSSHVFLNNVLAEIQYIERDGDGNETVRRTATNAESSQYLQQKSDRINQIAQTAAQGEFQLPPEVGTTWNEWADNTVSELELCSNNMGIAETSWVGWGTNARDTAMVETFRCLEYAFHRQAIQTDKLRDLLIAQGIIIVQE